MKKLLSILAILISINSYSQYDSTKVLQRQSIYGIEWRNLKVRDSGSLIIPAIDTSMQLAVKDSNSIGSYKGELYKWDGYNWVNQSGPSITASNGLTKIGSNVEFGGIFTKHTTLNANHKYFRIDTANYVSFQTWNDAVNANSGSDYILNNNLYLSDGEENDGVVLNSTLKSIFSPYPQTGQLQLTPFQNLLSYTSPDIGDTSYIFNGISGIILQDRQNPVYLQSGDWRNNHKSDINLYPDSTVIKPYNGNLKIYKLNYQPSSDNVLMVWDSIQHKVGYIPASFLGGGTLTNLTATNNIGQTWTITNPNTTPNLDLTLTSEAVGLGNVDNTPDLNKPISTATQAALNLKLNISDTSAMLAAYLQKTKLKINTIKYVFPLFTDPSDNSINRYSTIQAAINAASAGDLVYIFDTVYNEAITLKNGVNLYGGPGVNITYTGADGLATITDNGNVVDCHIEGYMSIGRTNGVGANAKAIYVSGVGTNLNLCAETVSSIKTGAAVSPFSSYVYACIEDALNELTVVSGGGEFECGVLYNYTNTGDVNYSYVALRNPTIYGNVSLSNNSYTDMFNLTGSGGSAIAMSDNAQLTLRNASLLENSFVINSPTAVLETFNSSIKNITATSLTDVKVNGILHVSNTISNINFTGKGIITRGANQPIIRGYQPSYVLASDVNGIVDTTTTTRAKLSLINNLTSDAQTQIDGKQDILGFTPENVSNKATVLSSPNNTTYPTTLAVSNSIASINQKFGHPSGDKLLTENRYVSGSNTYGVNLDSLSSFMIGVYNGTDVTPRIVANNTVTEIYDADQLSSIQLIGNTINSNSTNYVGNHSGTTIISSPLFQHSGDDAQFNLNNTFTTIAPNGASILTNAADITLNSSGAGIFAQAADYFNVDAYQSALNLTYLFGVTADQTTLNSRVNIGKSLHLPIVTKTSTYTATENDYTIVCDGTFTLNLPTVSGTATGRVYVIKDVGTGVITIDPNGSEMIDGFTTLVMNTQWSTVTIQSDGTKWFITNQL